MLLWLTSLVSEEATCDEFVELCAEVLVLPIVDARTVVLLDAVIVLDPTLLLLFQDEVSARLVLELSELILDDGDGKGVAELNPVV